jgi:hypothetical protein
MAVAYDVKLNDEQARELGLILTRGSAGMTDQTVILTQQGDGGVVVAFTRDLGATNVATFEISAAGTVTEDDDDTGPIAEESPDPYWMNP